MDSRRKALIAQRRKELEKKLGPNPLLHSSGRGIESKNEFPKKMRIKINSKVIEEYLFE